MVFNDDFLEEEYANLPEYEGTEMNPVSLFTQLLLLPS